MPFISSARTNFSVLGRFLRLGLSSFTDLFTRSNGSLGGPWIGIRGTWQIASNVAASSDAGNYPIAALDVANPTNQTLVANVTSGAGIVFWLSDSGNWWAVRRNESNFTTSFDCSYSVYVNQWCYTMFCSSCAYCEDGPFIGNRCDTWCPPGFGTQFFNSDTCTEYCYQYQFYTGGPCALWAYTDCSFTQFIPQTCSSSGTNRFIVLIRSVANTVSTVATASTSNTVATIKAIISGNSLNAIAYSNTIMTDNIGSITQSISNPGPKSGIILSPSDNQGSTVTKFNLS